MSTPKRPKRPRDPVQLAHEVFQEAIGEKPKAYDPPLLSQAEPTPVKPIDPIRQAAAELGRRGGLKGGPARAKKLSSEERSEAAKQAAQARWAKQQQSEDPLVK